MKGSAWILGLLAIAIFAGTLPATKFAVQGFSPEFSTAARAIIAAALSALLLICCKQPLPSRDQFAKLTVVSIGVVLGFPLFTSMALAYVSTTHSIISVGLLPLITAICGVVLGESKPQWKFWLYAAMGSASVMLYIYAIFDAAHHRLANLYLLLALIFCAVGYAQGGRLARQLGGWQVISWALLIALPLMLPLGYLYWPQQGLAKQPLAILGLLYLAVFSMFIGFICWYQALAKGGILKIGQLQLLQPALGLLLSAVLLKEQIGWMVLLLCGFVALCIRQAKKYC